MRKKKEREPYEQFTSFGGYCKLCCGMPHRVAVGTKCPRCGLAHVEEKKPELKTFGSSALADVDT